MRQRHFALALLILALSAALNAPPAIAQGPGPQNPARYADLTIAALAARTYGGGEVTIADTLAVTDAFTRYLIRYPSDGLTIYGFMNVPAGAGAFPVIVAVHGYIDPAVYTTLDYTTPYADALARAGYLVLHPNLRGYAPSDDGPNLFRVGMAIDVLNLIAIVRQTAGQPGALAQAHPEAIGVWGHSMGGGIALRVITVDQGVRAAVLYGAMSGNEAWNYAKIQEWSGGQRGRAELRAPAEAIEAISAINALDRIRAAVSIHHGAADTEVPPEWSVDLCERLRALDVTAQCISYLEQPHTFTGAGDQRFVQNMIAFYDAFLRPEAIP